MRIKRQIEILEEEENQLCLDKLELIKISPDDFKAFAVVNKKMAEVDEKLIALRNKL